MMNIPKITFTQYLLCDTHFAEYSNIWHVLTSSYNSLQVKAQRVQILPKVNARY